VPVKEDHQVQSEVNKKRREGVVIFLISVFFILLTWFEIRLFDIAQQLPFVHSVFFFGLVNFNIILLLFLLFMIFRNLVKVFVEKKNRVFGSSLKSKLTIAFLTFTIVPTLLIFVTNVTYVNASFDKWFNSKVQNVLKSSLELSQSYYFNAKKKNYHFAHLIAKKINSQLSPRQRVNLLNKALQEYSLDAVEFYQSQKTGVGREIIISENENIPMIPYLDEQLLERAFSSEGQASTIQTFSGGNLVRVVVPLKGKYSGAVVVSSFISLGLISKINDISQLYEEFRDSSPLEYPLKSIYLTILILMTLVILLAATWFGIYLAKQLSVPLTELGKATQRVAQGMYEKLEIKSGSDEITQLIDSFNKMSLILDQSRTDLKSTLSELDQHSRYNEEILRSISTGVLSVDVKGKITTINKKAGELLKLDSGEWIGKPVRELLTLDYFRTFAELIRMMNEHRVGHIQRELRINVGGDVIPMLLHLSILKSQEGLEIGKLAVFDDLTTIIQAQRAAAWREVARRIAHEIKNPLTPIKLSAERLIRKFGNQITDPAFQESATMIIRQTDELKKMVNEFSQFARLPETNPRLGQLNDLIQSSLTLYKDSYRDIAFSLELDFNLPLCMFDPEQMLRVMNNLIDNSVSAIKNQSVKNISVVTEFDEQLKIAKIRVCDNGPGIEADQKLQIFEPYFTTKNEGTGLGLSIVKRIIEDHNGFIRVLDNDNKRGVCLLIELPTY